MKRTSRSVWPTHFIVWPKAQNATRPPTRIAAELNTSDLCVVGIRMVLGQPHYESRSLRRQGWCRRYRGLNSSAAWIGASLSNQSGSLSGIIEFIGCRGACHLEFRYESTLHPVVDFGESVDHVNTWEGEAPAEPTSDPETHGSAGASPSRFHNRARRHASDAPHSS